MNKIFLKGVNILYANNVDPDTAKDKIQVKADTLVSYLTWIFGIILVFEIIFFGIKFAMANTGEERKQLKGKAIAIIVGTAIVFSSGLIVSLLGVLK